jgi:hypothetical protein
LAVVESAVADLGAALAVAAMVARVAMGWAEEGSAAADWAAAG